MQIRELVIDDVPGLIRMLEHFHKAAGMKDKYDPASMAITLRGLMQGGVVLVAEDDGLIGSAAAVFYPLYFNAHAIAGQELWWWVEPDHRKSGVGEKLLEELERLAQERGVAQFTMMSLESSPGVGKILQERGYSPLEHTYVKRFEDGH